MKAALITGALGGIGRALCKVFQEEGYRVIGTDRVEGQADCDVFIQADVERLCQDEVYREAFFDEVRLNLLGHRLEVLVNNAAIQLLNRTEDVSTSDWQRTLNTNLVAPFLLAQGLLPELEASQGSVVNMASIHAIATKPGFVCYATSKAALVGLTKAMAIDLGPRVRVNAINPAATATPMLLAGFEGKGESFQRLSSMHPLERIADPEEVARVAIFLASEQAKFITGAAFNIDGGMGARLHDPE
ncbi:Glucose 1-dehydrogenase 1 [compost metagenome]